MTQPERTIGLAKGPSIKSQTARLRLVPWRTILLIVVLSYIALIFMVPFFWMISTSLKTQAEVFSPKVGFFPHVLDWHNYPTVVSNRRTNFGHVIGFPFWQDLKNTVEIAGLSTLGTVISSAMVAYALALLRWRARNTVFLVVLSHMMIPIWITIIPLYLIFVKIHWINTFLPLIVPSYFGSAFSIFLLRQFFMRQPVSLLDAARMDGANELRIFVQLVLPLARAALAVVALFAFMWSWTDFFSPLVFLSDPSKYTLMLGLAAFQGKHATLWPELMAANIIIISPILILFFFAQRQFIEGFHFSGLGG